MSGEEILVVEIEKLNISTSEVEKSNIQFNIIKLKIRLNQKKHIYKDIKNFIDNYIKTIRLGDYGYDDFNYSKINQLIQTLPAREQIEIIQYVISVVARELPEYDRSWFITRKHKAEIKDIIENKKFPLYPKTILLFLGQSMTRLLLGVIFLIFATSLLLLPAPIESLAFFNVTYEGYSDNKTLNHFMNILSIFADLDNDLQIQPVNFLGLLLIIAGKLIFVTIIVNFIYFKLSDKISQK